MATVRFSPAFSPEPVLEAVPQSDSADMTFPKLDDGFVDTILMEKGEGNKEDNKNEKDKALIESFHNRINQPRGFKKIFYQLNRLIRRTKKLPVLNDTDSTQEDLNKLNFIFQKDRNEYLSEANKSLHKKQNEILGEEKDEIPPRDENLVDPFASSFGDEKEDPPVVHPLDVQVRNLDLHNKLLLEENKLIARNIREGNIATLEGTFEEETNKQETPEKVIIGEVDNIFDNDHLEDVPSLAKRARERIGESLVKMKDAYKKQPPAVKLGISLSLISAGFFVPATGVAAGALIGANVIMRGLGSYIAGETTEELVASYLKKKNQGGEISKKGKLLATTAKWMVMLSSFVASEWSDATKVYHGIEELLGATSDTVLTVPPITTEVVQTPDIVSPPVDTILMPTEIPEVKEFQHTNFVGTHEVIVRAGDTLSKVLLHGGINEMFTAQDIAGLTWKAKQNLLENITNNLTPNQLREVGISSGSKDLLRLGETIDIKKLAILAKDLTVLVGGERVPLLKRALDLSKMS